MLSLCQDNEMRVPVILGGDFVERKHPTFMLGYMTRYNWNIKFRDGVEIMKTMLKIAHEDGVKR